MVELTRFLTITLLITSGYFLWFWSVTHETYFDQYRRKVIGYMSVSLFLAAFAFHYLIYCINPDVLNLTNNYYISLIFVVVFLFTLGLFSLIKKGRLYEVKPSQILSVYDIIDGRRTTFYPSEGRHWLKSRFGHIIEEVDPDEEVRISGTHRAELLEPGYSVKVRYKLTWTKLDREAQEDISVIDPEKRSEQIHYMLHILPKILEEHIKNTIEEVANCNSIQNEFLKLSIEDQVRFYFNTFLGRALDRLGETVPPVQYLPSVGLCIKAEETHKTL